MLRIQGSIQPYNNWFLEYGTKKDNKIKKSRSIRRKKYFWGEGMLYFIYNHTT